MANQNADNQPGPSSRSEFIPWKLIPVDLEKTLGKEANVQLQVSPRQMPKPTLSILCSIPYSFLGVELPDESCTIIKSALLNIHQDTNRTHIATDASNKLKSPSSIPEPTSSMKSSSPVDNTAKRSSKNLQNASKRTSLAEKTNNRPVLPSPKLGPPCFEIGPEDESKFIALVRKHSHLYDTEDPFYRDKKKKRESWIAIGKKLGITDGDCQTRWKSLRAKYNRVMKLILDDEDRVSNKNKRFIQKMKFLPYNQRTRTKRKNISEKFDESSENSSMKRKKGDSTSESVFGPTSSKNLQRSEKISKTKSHSNARPPVQKETRIRYESACGDKLFAEDVALELQRSSPKLKNVLKAKIWQVLAEFGNPI